MMASFMSKSGWNRLVDSLALLVSITASRRPSRVYEGEPYSCERPIMRPSRLNTVQLIGLLAAFSAGVLSPWCYGASSKLVPYNRREIARRVSPDETQDAVLIEVRNRYMSYDVSYEVQIWKHAMPDGVTPPVFTAGHAAGLN